ncbi:putative alpha beta hydrolase fold family protein [Botrytis cinerea BcDW1]|uniref:Putative alpha beta hydrolase fold family protein n=1 Tax=Botryotinia fuckeliana (strain BcDW1) TaxID=1290391 RepID=M7TP50_BOTF1|nr:putative alpha beta hydrolase fold family protein [Botrytis cinerea BcDW1]
MASSSRWTDLSDQLHSTLPVFDELINKDPQYNAFVKTPAILHQITFGIGTSTSNDIIIVVIDNGKCQARVGTAQEASFILLASLKHWEQFFQPIPVAPFQSYWGMFGMNIKQKDIEIQGDQISFTQHTHIWRRVLEVLHDAYCGPMKLDEEPEVDEDHVIGRYVYLDIPTWGRCKVFYEQSGSGKQDIVFLHTAGADGRQYHGVMNHNVMREECNMIAFDLPGHGKSYPPPNHCPGDYTNTEDTYVGAITAIVKKLKLNKPIICGASMAGQVCLAVATRADEVGAGGTIPLQGCEYLNMDRQFNDQSPYVNQSLFNPEWVYGMMSPTTPLANKQLIWHMYSASAYGIFHGDLDFYFGGFDGRARVSNIDTKKCPVFMLTGDYDWSNTPTVAQATCDKIPGAKHKAMPDIGHFPATEKPQKFVPHLLEAIEWIRNVRMRNGGGDVEVDGLSGRS